MTGIIDATRAAWGRISPPADAKSIDKTDLDGRFDFHVE